MALPRYVLALALLALAAPAFCKVAPSSTNNNKQWATKWANQIIAEGEALIPLFRKQFTDSLDALEKRYLAAQKAERDGASAADKAAVNKLIDKMGAATRVMLGQLSFALRGQKIKDLTVLIKQYRTLITSRLTATGAEATNTQKLLDQRWRKQNFTIHWERDQVAAMVKAINEHQQAALGVYKTLKDAKVKATVRAITDRLMQKLIDEVSILLNLTTVKLFPRIEDFAVDVGRLLFRLAVSAKSNNM